MLIDNKFYFLNFICFGKNKTTRLVDFFIQSKSLITDRSFFSELLLLFMLFLLIPSSEAQSIKKPLRVVSLSPHITETIFKLKADHLLVGRTNFCNYPSAASKIESVGGYLNIDYEKIVVLKPDLIFQFPNEDNRRKLETLGFQVISVPNETISEILAGIKLIGKGLDEEEQAERLINHIQDTLKLVTGSGENQNRLVSALLVVGRQPGSLAHLYLAGAKTYISELWSLCGGANVFSDINHRYFSVNAEDILTRNIDVILEFQPDWNLDPQRMQAEKKVWAHFSSIAAVKKSKIYIFSQQFFVIPGPRITQIAIEFSKIIKLFLEESK
jgi:iron complex transport system substrate-binding protein